MGKLIKFEIYNFISELLWTSIASKDCINEIILHEKYNYGLILTGIILHAPCSLNLHSLRIFGYAAPNSYWAKVDQFSIIFACYLYLFATSKTYLYPLTISFLSTPFFFRRKDSTNKERTLYISMATLAYIIPIFSKLFPKGIIYLLVGSLFHLNNDKINNYGTAILHMCMIPYHKSLLKCI